MPFAPHEMENKKFVVALRGYAKEEVETFLRAVAADYRALLEEIGKQPAAAAEWPAEMSASIESIMREAWDAAEETRRRVEQEAAEIRSAAERDARWLRETAADYAAKLRAAAQRDAEEYRAEIDRRIDELHRTEDALRQKLYSVESALAIARVDLDDPVRRAPVLTAVR